MPQILRSQVEVQGFFNPGMTDQVPAHVRIVAKDGDGGNRAGSGGWRCGIDFLQHPKL